MATESAQSPEGVPAPQPAPGRKKKKHWILRIIAALVVLLLLAALAVQIVLWTDLPRGIVVGQIERQLGLKLQVKTLATTWLGHTELHDVTVSLPLADKAFLDVPVMKVKNTSIFGLILGRPVAVKSIVLEQPHLYVWQDSNGRWNLQEVAELLQRAGGKKSGEQSAATSSSPAMPNVHLVGGTITVADNKSHSVDIGPLAVDGYPETPVSWKYDVQIPPRVSLTGRLVPGGNWQHEVALNVQDLGVWAKPFTADFPAIALDAKWRGSIGDAGVGGRLDLRKFTVLSKSGDFEAAGALDASTGGGVVSVRPANLHLKTGQHALPEIVLAGGAITFNSTANDVKSDQLLVSLFGGAAKVNADYNLAAGTGKLSADWDRLALPNDVTHSGHFDVALSRPFPKVIGIQGNILSTGQTPGGPWIASAKLRASGESFTDFDWIVDAKQLQWQRRGPGIDLDGLALRGSLRKQIFTVQSISLPDPQLLAGNVTYHLDGDQPWHAALRGQRWPFHPIEGTELAFAFEARGNRMQAALDNFLLKSPDISLSANGKYVFLDPKPLTLEITIVNAPPTQAPVAVASTKEAKILNGTIDGHAKLTGTLDPLKLDVTGSLNGREIDVRGHHIGEIDLALSKESHIDPNGVFIYTDALNLLGGKWGIDGIYVFNTDEFSIDTNIKEMALADVANLLDQKDVSGTMDATVRLVVPGLNPNPTHLRVEHAPVTLRNINISGAKVEQVDATVSLKDGILRIEPIRLKNGIGRGDARLAMAVTDFHKIDFGATIAAWPMDSSDGQTHLDAWVGIPDLLIELPDAQAKDPKKQNLRLTARQMNVRGVAMYKGQFLADLTAYAGIDGREIDVRAIHLAMLGGRVDGQAHANLDNLLVTSAEVTWENVDTTRLAALFPDLKELHGKMTGNARLAPATVPRPRAPLAFVVTTEINGGHWRTIPIQDARLAGYIDPGPAHQAGWRLLLDDTPSDRSFIHVDDGTVEIWGRTAGHGADSSSQINIRLVNLGLDNLLHAFDPTAHPMPGLISGSITLLRAPPPPPGAVTVAGHIPPNRMFPAPPRNPVPPAKRPGPQATPLELLIEPIYGEGSLKLTKANLANFGPFAALYNFAHLFQNVKDAEGHGGVDFHLEKGTFNVEHLRYFNRGTEIRAVASVYKVWEAADSKVEGTAFLSAQPLKNTKVFFLADFQSVLTAVQSSLQLTGVHVTGQLKTPKISPPLAVTDMTDEMRRFIVGDVKKELQGGSGG